MSYFVTRLEHELIRAAEREASPARRFAARTPRVLVPALAVACAALLVVGLLRAGSEGDDRPRAIRPTIVPAALLGSWSGDGAVALIIDRDRYTLRRGNQSTSGDLAAHERDRARARYRRRRRPLHSRSFLPWRRPNPDSTCSGSVSGPISRI
jgi:hypothetical protein